MLFTHLVLYFTIYSFVGWLWEVFYIRVTERRWNNQGFLTGPYLPIYGFGAVLILLFIAPLEIDTFWKFILSGVLATIAEYITHFLLEKLFGMRLWDYSHFPLNIRGRVCLFASLAFAALALLVIDIVHPLVESVVGGLPELLVTIVACALSVLLVADTISSLMAATSYRRGTLRRKLHRLHQWNIKRLTRAFPSLKR